jgi:GH43 family beta-xylosidase
MQIALIRRGYTSSSELIGTFSNPILPAPSADPWLVQHEGFYYYCESRLQESIYIRKARCLTELRQDPGTQVWSAPAFGANSKSVWAPELHFLNGRWYIYYAADDGLNENHRMWVLESVGTDPLGPYRCRGQIETAEWAIDGTVLQLDGALYFIWSGWPGAVNGQQNLYIAPMKNPWTLAGRRSLLARPEMTWEKMEMAICEGPQVLQKHGRTFIVYSASGSWSEHYCLGLLEFTEGTPLAAENWKKRGCIFSRNALVHGVGHCSFVQSPDQTEDWIIYHTKTKRKHGWNDRTVHAQRFTWTEEGLPYLGTPIAAGVPIPLPAR